MAQTDNTPAPEYITLTNDLGERVDFEELAGVELADDRVYVILQPVPSSDDYEEDEVFIFRVEERDDGNASYYAEQDPDIIETVLSAYDRMLETADTVRDTPAQN